MTRECKDARALIQADLDGELPDLRRGVLDAHVATCAACAAELAAARLAASALSHMPAPAPSHDFAAVVSARVASIRAQRLRLWRRLAWLTAALGGAVSVTLATAWAAFLGPVWDAAAGITIIFPPLANAFSHVAMAIGRGLLPIGAALAKVSWPGLGTLATYYGAALAILLLIVIATARGRRWARIPALAF